MTLHTPPPLDTALALDTAGASAQLRQGESKIATARQLPLILETPAAPDLAAATDAASRYVGFEKHIFPRCFVCGPDREEGDGLRIFAGPLRDQPIAAAPWTPVGDFADSHGQIRPEFVWAALDCPGYFGLLQPGLVTLLGRMHGEIHRLPENGETCVVAGWRIGQDGRKHFAGTALYGANGDVLARASAIWIELDRSRFSAL